MSERSHEELSVLMDGEASGMEIRRTVRALDEDTELLGKWRRYHIARSVMQGDMREERAADFTRMDLSSRVSAALESEAAYEVANSSVPGWYDRFVKPLSSVAVAASVSALVVFGWQNFQQTGESNIANPGSGSVAGVYTQVPVSGTGFQTVSESQQHIQRNVINQAEIIRLPSEQNRRLNQYLVSHSGNAALNTASGSMSYSRVVHIAP